MRKGWNMQTKFFNEWDKLKVKDNINFYIIIALALVIITQTIVLVVTVSNKTIVILPPKVDKEFYVVGNTLSKSYLEQVAFYLSDRILSVSPTNANISFEIVAPFLSTNIDEQQVIKKTLKEQAKLVIAENLFQSFYPNKFFVNEKDSIMSVTGVLRKFIGDMFVQSKEQKVDYHYKIKSGRLIITGVDIK